MNFMLGRMTMSGITVRKLYRASKSEVTSTEDLARNLRRELLHEPVQRCPICILVIPRSIRVFSAFLRDLLHDQAQQEVVFGIQQRAGDRLGAPGMPARLRGKPVQHTLLDRKSTRL